MTRSPARRQSVGLLVDGVPVAGRGAGTEVECGARPDAVLRRGRRPARRHRRHHARRRRGDRRVEVDRRSAPAARTHRAPGPGAGRARSWSDRPCSRRSTLSAGGRSRASHTATHLVHRAFRGALGESAAQAGSENAPGRFRFDFTAPARCRRRCSPTPKTKSTRSWSMTWKCAPTTPPSRGARRMGALALFGEKYGDRGPRGRSRRLLARAVRRHARGRSGHLGLIKVLGESSIGSGVRRVEALVGIDAFRFLARESVLVSQLSEQLKAPREELPERIAGVVARLREAERELERLRGGPAARVGRRNRGRRGGHQRDGAGRAPGAGRDRARRHPQARARRARPGAARRPAVVVIIGVPADKPVVVDRGQRGGPRLRLGSGLPGGTRPRALGGNGGGKPDVAQGGGAPDLGQSPRCHR